MADLTLPEGFGTFDEALQRVHATAKEAVAELNEMRPRPSGERFSCRWPLFVSQTRFCIDQDGDVEIEVCVTSADQHSADLHKAVKDYIAARHPELAAYVLVVSEW